MPCVVEFKECAECAVKPGSPALCPSCLNNQKVIYEFAAHLRREQKQEGKKKRGTKQFRIKQLSVSRIAVDTEPTKERDSHSSDSQDVVVTLVDKDGSRFEVHRMTVHDTSLFVGSDTSVADLVCRRSWGSEGLEGDDASVSCPLCLFSGHGAGACKAIRR
jgi:hypothetical protein